MYILGHGAEPRLTRVGFATGFPDKVPGFLSNFLDLL
jgi:hypothetical protein